MGGVFKKSIPWPIPSSARIGVDGRGRKVARWKPRGSTKAITAVVDVLPDGREIARQQSDVWYRKYRDASGVVHTESTQCRDESNARAYLAERERRVEQVKAGVLSTRQAKAVDHLRDALGTHVDACVGSIRGKRGGIPSTVHVANVGRYLSRVAADCAW